MATSLPPPSSSPRRRTGSDVLVEWDQGFRRVFGFIGTLVFVFLLGLTAVFAIGAVVYLSAGSSSIATSFIVCTVLLLIVVQRLARIRRGR